MSSTKSEIDFLHLIRRLRSYHLLYVLGSSLPAGCILTVAFLCFSSEIVQYHLGLHFHTIPFLSRIALSFVISYALSLLFTFPRMTFILFLKKADKELLLKDRLTSAYEAQLLSGKKKHSDMEKNFILSLFEDTVNVAQKADFSRLYRLAIRGEYFLLLSILGLYLFLIFYPWTYRHAKNLHSILSEIESAQILQFSDQSSRDSLFMDKKEHFLRKTELIRRMRDSANTADSLLMIGQELLNEIESQEMEIIERLKKKSSSSDDRDAARKEGDSKFHLSRPGASAPQTTMKLSQDMENLSRSDTTEKEKTLLDNLKEMDRLKSQLRENLKRLAKEQNAFNVKPTAQDQPSPSAPGEKNDQAKSGQNSPQDTQSANPSDTESQGPDASNDNSREKEEDDQEDKVYQAAKPGDRASDRRLPEKEEILPARGIPVKDRISSLPALDNMSIQVRSVTDAGRTGDLTESIIRIYKKQNENALLKEDISPQYEEYIRNYFLSLGF